MKARHPPGLVDGEQRRQFYERHRTVAVILIAVLFFGPIVGLYMGGVSGLVLGVAIPALSYYVLPVLLR